MLRVQRECQSFFVIYLFWMYSVQESYDYYLLLHHSGSSQ